MRIKSLILKALAAAAFVVSVSVSCSEVSFIEINPPADLQSKIDSIQAVKDSLAALKGDRTDLTIATGIVGAEDYSSGWWSAFSDYFQVPQGKCLTVNFINHNGGSANNWNNWNLCVASGERDSDGYSEFFVIRSDAYGWGNADYNGAMIKQDYPDTDGDGDIWNDFRAHLDGASVSLQVDYASAGVVFVTTTHTAVDGTVLTQTYEQPVTGPTVTAFLIADASWMEVKEAYLEPSKIAEIPDEMAASITVTGTPATLEIGQTDFWGNGVATVTFADGSTTVADTADVTFVVPDLTTVGEKTIIYSYSKTKQGNYGKAVAGTYTLEVVNPVVSLEITKQPALTTYYVYETAPATLAFSTAGMEVKATYADGTSGVMNNSSLVFGEVPVTPGEQSVEVKYVGVSSTVTATCKVNVVKGVAEVGLLDCTTPWWTAFTQDKVVAAGESVTFKMMVYSLGGENYHSPCTILRQADLVENAVVRMDHFGWGTGFDGNDTKVVESNWNWDTFKPNINLSNVTITVTNNGDDTADIRYAVIYPNGEEHFQNYLGLKVNSADLQTALVTEGSYLVLYE